MDITEMVWLESRGQSVSFADVSKATLQHEARVAEQMAAQYTRQAQEYEALASRKTRTKKGGG